MNSERVTTHDLKNGDLVSTAAGIFRISNRRVSTGHRVSAGHYGTLTNEEFKAMLDAPENATDCIVFDGVAVDPEQNIRKWTVQGNDLATFGLIAE